MSDNITPVDSDVCAVTFDKKEYAIVGDALFAQTVEEVPGWMQELVGDLVDTSVADAYNAMTGFNYNLYNAMLALQVAENTYQQVINSKITDQEAFVQAVETLNSTVQNSQAEIVGIKQTYATKDFAIATAATTLEASLNGGAIKSSLGQLASTMTNQYGTMAQRMDALESTFDDLGAGVEGYANATSGLETFVGKNAPGTNAPVIASSKFYQDLNVYLAGTDYTTGGTNTLVNQVTAAATGVESKFAYNSSLKLNGATYNSGFGLATSLTPGSGIPVGSSEFWINADKFKLTTTGYNGVKYSPFSVNGTDGTITFNGKVSFNSVTNVPNYTLPEDVANAIASSGFVLPGEVANAINTNTTTIDGAKITTGTIQAGAIAAGAITADKVNADVFSGRTIIGGNIYGTRIEGASIIGAVIKSSWIDYSNTGVLTNWQYFTPTTVPSQYVGNFAKNTNGTLIVDSLGYVRLPGSNVVRTEAHSQNLPPSASRKVLTPFAIKLRSYDYYQDASPNRYTAPDFVLDGTGKIILRAGNGPDSGGWGQESAKAVFYVGNVNYEVYCYEYNHYDLTGYIKENGVVVGTTNWHRKGQLTVNRTPYGIPVTITVYYEYSMEVTITIGNSSAFVSGYSGIRDLINVVEAWSDNNPLMYRAEASANFGIFTAHV